MTDKPDFSLRIDQNQYLPEGGREVHAIVTVEASGAPVVTAPTASEVIIIDTSGSMDYPRAKMTSAVRAAQTAVDTLRDGVEFAVVSGSSRATMVYPSDERLVPADQRTRAEAKEALSRLTAAGGTAIGSWLGLAGRLFAARQDGIRHAILLTDGKNQHESPEQLDAAIAACTGRFVCDCRGVGTDWEVPELRKVSSGLLGSLDIVASPEDLEADFRAMTEAAMGKAVADVTLRVSAPQHAELRFVKQVLPTVEDLTGRRTDVDGRSGDYPLGAWGTESRDYHICTVVPPGAVGRPMRAAQVQLVVDGDVLAKGNILAEWTRDEALSTRINPKVAHYTGQAELAENIQVGLQARKEGDEDTATFRLGRAVALAHESGNEQIATLLDKVVDVEDAATGRVRLRKDVQKVDEMSLDTVSTKTVRARRA